MGLSWCFERPYSALSLIRARKGKNRLNPAGGRAARGPRFLSHGKAECQSIQTSGRLDFGPKALMRELDHGLAGSDLFVVLVAHDDVDQDPARVCRHLLRS